MKVKVCSLIVNIQSDSLEKRFGRYRQPRGASYFGSEKQFLDAEMSIRAKFFIKFHGCKMKERSSVMGNDSVKALTEATHCGKVVTEKLLERPDHAHVTQMNAYILYHVDGFISKS